MAAARFEMFLLHRIDVCSGGHLYAVLAQVNLLAQRLGHEFLEAVDRFVLTQQEHGIRGQMARHVDDAVRLGRDLGAQPENGVEVERRPAREDDPHRHGLGQARRNHRTGRASGRSRSGIS